MDPMTAALLAQLGVSTIGGLIQGIMSGKITQAQLAMAQSALAQQGGLGQEALGQGGINQSNQLQRQNANLPLRDQAAYMLQQRLGMAPQKFQAGNFYNPQGQPGQAGGIDQNALQQAAGAYKPGMGGQMGTGQFNETLLQQLGYKKDPKTGQWTFYGPQISSLGSYGGKDPFATTDDSGNLTSPLAAGYDNSNYKQLLAQKKKPQIPSIVNPQPDTSNPGWTGY